ncbi:MAG: hypothetical protein RL264_216 [Bacteroidota bacterium]|jgi:uncharacterized protein with ParB-like and HNH nuclease domain
MRNSNNISIKTINDLLKSNFFIPSYQRGYRWTEQQVTELLNDINEFSPKEIENSNEKTWYCLQPIVVKKKEDNEWDLIDGQQRLTTTFLILHYLNQGYVENRRKKLFGLKYETRENSADYLQKELIGETINDTNIDYFFISSAYKTICDWFKNKGEQFDVNTFESKFNFFTKVIWYETSAKDDSIDIFTRINSGKIPLTNAELIKALFLNNSNFAQADNEKIRLKQLEIASEWDRIEYALQDDSFWYFINKNENNLTTRIEFIFDLMSDKPSDDKYSTFHFFNEKFKTKSEKEINDNWQEIKKNYQTLEDWYNDRELYHKIGYLITIGTNIKTILGNKENKQKSEFGKWIDQEIKKIVSKNQVDELEYGQGNGQLINVLLLHNIITTLNSNDSSLRFPFNKYKEKKNGGWSLEHIHAQNSDDIREIDDFEEWLKIIDTDILTEEIKTEIIKFNNDKQREKVSSLVEKISSLFGETDIHSIENMALLSKNDNSKLNNGLFPVKRERIIELEKNGAFIPIATKKVFQKYFEGCTKQLSKWEEKDRNAYLNNIKETLKNYLPQTELAENEQ